MFGIPIDIFFFFSKLLFILIYNHGTKTMCECDTILNIFTITSTVKWGEYKQFQENY